jgi:hypothetical protein
MSHGVEQERHGPAEDRRTGKMKLQLNEGPIDRLVRIVLGFGLLAAAAAGWVAAPFVYVVWLVTAIALVTGVTGFCPTYVPFGISTRSAGRR